MSFIYDVLQDWGIDVLNQAMSEVAKNTSLISEDTTSTATAAAVQHTVPINIQPPIEACDMCRIKVPCFCSLSSADFYLPPRYTGCTVRDGDRMDEHVSYKYHLNSAIVKSLFPMSDEAKYLSYEYSTTRLNPLFQMPDIKFHVEK